MVNNYSIRLKTIAIEDSPLILKNGDVSITNTTISSNGFTGSLICNGGISINCTYDSYSSTSGGALTIRGGMAIKNSTFLGGNMTMDSPTSILQINGVTDNRLYLNNTNFYICPDGVNKVFDLHSTYLSINITTGSTNSSSGGLILSGGLSINCSDNAISGSNGGALTISGGLAIGKDLFASKTINVGEQYSGNNGIVINYTGYEQLALTNSSGSFKSSLNMVGDNFYLTNKNDITIQSSIGNIVFSNISQSSGNVLFTIYPTYTNFSRLVTITDTTTSINSSIGSLVLNGGLSINSTIDSSSFTQGGAVTFGGGLAVAKKILTGDLIGINNNNNQNNKLLLYGGISQNNLFTGLGSISSGNLRYQVSDSTLDHIFYSGSTSNTSNEIFRIKGSNEVVFMGKSQMYSVLGGGDSNNSLSFQGNLTASDMSINMYTADGDSNDSIN